MKMVRKVLSLLVFILLILVLLPFLMVAFVLSHMKCWFEDDTGEAIIGRAMNNSPDPDEDNIVFMN